ncbi:arrestin/PY protein 2 [Schizosaccharomyces cryophilus OY26]|uniref:Arrestin/PY protein 2 n=1 Tax=Schizosaccharomyces cryophilus (strain OY26 / ATCC MYA-4695 / CBS 11777 / NBRC 106824 / NRRL Y48691) TaxID=653667 RepID=S9VYP1_SCHCR|nr:arrestin/PY protein 2 [Schizosaccharomyces cryophilus OY26]EPY51319.1 arrestin/PY protein 2 [Schizosaccharomyces cryophilus OY26]
MNTNSLSNRHKSPVKLFEVRLYNAEANVIVLYGNSLDSAARLSGIVVLSISQPIRVRNIKLRLTGRSFVCWSDESRNSSNGGTKIRRQVNQILDRQWSFLSGDGNKTIQDGNYEYPFDYQLPQDVPESIEGVPGCHIVYTLTACLERATIPSSNLESALQLRLIRTIPPNSLDLMHSMSVSDIWPSKVNYETSIPSKVYAIGSEIPINLKLYPLLKGLGIGKVTIVLKEYCSLFITSKAFSSTSRKDFKRVLAKKTVPGLAMIDDCWQDQIKIPIPDSLGECTQDCDLNCIRVHHKLRLSISLLNPDGHISELRNSLPLSLVVSPVMFGARPVEGVFSGNHASYINENVLPSYDRHIFDVLWDGVPTESTPVLSERTTPITSRRNSSDFGPTSPILSINTKPFASNPSVSSPSLGSQPSFYIENSTQSPTDRTEFLSPITSPIAPFSGACRRAARSRASSTSSSFGGSQIQGLQPENPFLRSTSPNRALPVRSVSTLSLQELGKLPPYYEAHSAFSNVLPLDGLPHYEQATRPSSPTPSPYGSQASTVVATPTPTVRVSPIETPNRSSPRSVTVIKSKSSSNLTHHGLH